MAKGVDTCKYAVWDPVWGEWKCKRDSIRLYLPTNVCPCCADYELGEPETSENAKLYFDEEENNDEQESESKRV